LEQWKSCRNSVECVEGITIRGIKGKMAESENDEKTDSGDELAMNELYWVWIDGLVKEWLNER
jgi:hypothetical protein